LAGAHELYSAVDAELDYLEFIALGVTNEVFDYDMIKNAFEADFINLYETTTPYISYTREGNEEVWSSFCVLAPKWGAEPTTALPKKMGRKASQAGAPI
jgi:hypothetical protein